MGDGVDDGFADDVGRDLVADGSLSALGAGAGPATIKSGSPTFSFSNSRFRCSAENFTFSSLRPLRVNSAMRLSGG